MQSRIDSLRQGLALCLLVASTSSCSFFGEHPIWAPIAPTKEGVSKCGDITYPLVDALSVVAGATWVYAAHRDEEATRTVYSEPHSTSWTRFERTFGYSAMITFGAATIYGAVAEARCRAARKRFEQARVQAVTTEPQRPGFPANVFALRFGTSPVEAERACLAMRRQWHLEGTLATCNAEAASSANPDARIEFRFNALATLILTFTPAASNALRDYDALESGLTQMYGKPQRGRATLSTSCAADLAQCLAQGEKPRGPTWRWAAGSIELAPTEQAGAAVIELRYSWEDPGGR